MVRLATLVSFQLAGIVMILATVSTVGADTFSIATGTNTTLATAQSISLTPNLVLHQQAPNYTLATAQSVSPQYRAYDVLGSINAGISQEFFSFPLSDGNQLTSFVSAGNPATQFPELLLYNANGNLVAVAAGNGADGSSSQIDFTIPGGQAGNWAAEVTGSPNAPPGNNFFNYDLRLSGPFINYQTNVLGAFDDPNHSGFYSVAAKDGDNLHFFVQAGNPATQFPELLLYDPNGNLVAVAAGNGADGSSSEIDFTVPGGDAGNWAVEVTSSPNAPPGNNFFNYDLLITGDTGVGPIDPLKVHGTAVVPEPSTFSIMATGALACLAFIRCRKLARPIAGHN